MTIINYSSTDLLFAEKNGNFEITDFSEFITTLLHSKISNHVKKNILLKVDKYGTKNLTEVEKFLLNQIIVKYKKNCLICNEEIPLSQSVIDDVTIYCSYHKQYIIDQN